jgi:hypothetical protein
MDTIVQIGDQLIDLQGLQELQDDGRAVSLFFDAAHDPPFLTLVDADAQLLRDWMDRYTKTYPNGLDFMVPKPRKQPDSKLIQQLRSLALSTEHSSDVLAYLADQVNDEETFTDYLLATFGDDSGIWLVAHRWWVISWNEC